MDFLLVMCRLLSSLVARTQTKLVGTGFVVRALIKTAFVTNLEEKD